MATNPKPPGSKGMEAPVSLTFPGGLHRVEYFLAVLGIAVLYKFSSVWAATSGYSVLIQIGIMVVSVVAVASRLKNIGVTPWWALVFIVPLLNVIIGVTCLALPENYWHHRQLDLAAWVVYGLFGGVILIAGVTLY
jgi:uncharacterized membrane protein YhaH (DUF805 family)